MIQLCRQHHKLAAQPQAVCAEDDPITQTVSNQLHVSAVLLSGSKSNSKVTHLNVALLNDPKFVPCGDLQQGKGPCISWPVNLPDCLLCPSCLSAESCCVAISALPGSATLTYIDTNVF